MRVEEQELRLGGRKRSEGEVGTPSPPPAMCPSACLPGSSEVHRALAVSLVVEFLDLRLEVPQFVFQVEAASLFVQKDGVLGRVRAREVLMAVWPMALKLFDPQFSFCETGHLWECQGCKGQAVRFRRP